MQIADVSAMTQLCNRAILSGCLSYVQAAQQVQQYCTLSDRDLGHLRVNSILPTEESTDPLFFATIMCASMSSLYTNTSIYYSALCHEQRIFLWGQLKTPDIQDLGQPLKMGACWVVRMPSACYSGHYGFHSQLTNIKTMQTTSGMVSIIEYSNRIILSCHQLL